MSIIYLVKKNDELISHCNCEESLVGAPGQLDCPWCGCGWLFSCTKCRKAFTFATGVELEKTWDEIAKEDLFGYSKKEPSEEEITEWIDLMKEMMEHIEPGRNYIYLDGHFIPVDQGRFEAEGWHAKHDFPEPPQVTAIADLQIIDAVLANREYWDGAKI
ncbi:hypothetical protein [Stutzerimonas chloritidismutans]|uniref:hypothetical protein n=1 Tax=Stutzerimonas chloritidismutans TaxID=203192 RepID=UPI001D192C23|nr:hypothetical protein [Stutzerimonas chloritidismutans]UEG61317.1 hypothetical protein LLJ08_19680 [Stutzerimonas chloritidismutans]